MSDTSLSELAMRAGLRSTASTRAFTADPVDDAMVARVLDTARFAPSGGNTQPWHVIVVKDPERRAAVRDLARQTWREYVAQMKAGVRPFALSDHGRWPGPGSVDLDAATRDDSPAPFLDAIDQAPVLLVVTVHLPSIAAMDAELDRHGIVGGASIYPFCWTILLAARAEGLGGVLTTFLVRREPAAKEVLAVPEDHAVAAMLVLGHPVKVVTKLTRRPVSTFATIDTFDGPPLPDA
jgi:nitroreductase